MIGITLLRHDGIDASTDAVGGDSNVTRFNVSQGSHGVAHVASYSQVASQGDWSCQFPSCRQGHVLQYIDDQHLDVPS
jgi:hypothetical protein